MKKSKCAFSREVSYLGHIISTARVAMVNQKVRAVVEWPVPQSMQVVCAFLSLAGYYRRFINDYDTIAVPLTARLRKAGLRWMEEVEAAFHVLQPALTTAPQPALTTAPLL
jgi:hypothetical protein